MSRFAYPSYAQLGFRLIPRSVAEDRSKRRRALQTLVIHNRRCHAVPYRFPPYLSVLGCRCVLASTAKSRLVDHECDRKLRSRVSQPHQSVKRYQQSTEFVTRVPELSQALCVNYAGRVRCRCQPVFVIVVDTVAWYELFRARFRLERSDPRSNNGLKRFGGLNSWRSFMSTAFIGGSGNPRGVYSSTVPKAGESSDDCD